MCRKVSIDRKFSPKQKKLIKESLRQWEKATHGLVTFRIVNSSARSLEEDDICHLPEKAVFCDDIYIACYNAQDEFIQEINTKNFDKFIEEN